MGAKLGGDDDAPIAEINIVPFVDIILVVLIIFMVTATVIVKPSININLPKAASGEDTTPSQLSITIGADGQTFLNGKPANDDQVAETAKEQLAKNPQVQAIISADKSVEHGRVITIIDIVKSAGITKFAISIDKK